MFRTAHGARFLVLLVLCLACGALRSNAQPLPDRRNLSGRVASTTNVPIGGAQIQIKRQETNANAAFWGTTVLSDVAGEWSVPEAEDGDYIISATALGYESWSSPYRLKEYAPWLRISLRRNVSLTFTLRDAEGQPLRGKRATIFGYATNAGQWQRGNAPGTTLGGTTLTNAAGECVLPNISAGIYHGLYAAVRGVGHAKWQGKIEILEGASQHFDLQIEKASASLRVKVMEESNNEKTPGRPLGGTRIYPQAAQPLQASDQTLALWLFRQNELISSDGTGIAALSDLVPGRYQIRANTSFYCDLAKPSEVTQTIDLAAGDEKELIFRLPPCFNQTPSAVPSLQVTLQDEQGMPLANRRVILYCQQIDEASELPLQAPPITAVRVPLSSERHGTTDAEGNLTLYPFWPGSWRISAYESGARLPFHGTEKVTMKAEENQVTIRTALNRDVEDLF